MAEKPLSRQFQVSEIIKCGKDPIYFIKKYAKIRHPVKGTIPFDTYPFQDDCVRDFQKHRLNIVLKSRQLGLSTICAAYAVWLAIFYKDKNILVIATKLSTAMNFVSKVRVMIDSLPPWLLLPKYEPTKQSIAFDNGSVITAIPTSEDAGRSEALSLLIIDEAAFIRQFEDIWTGLAPTFSTGGSAIILSTPNGVGGQYYRLWMEAEAGQNEFNPIRLPWSVHPEHDRAWFLKETRSLPARKIAQEYECVGGDSRIITIDGFKRAADIVVGDLVLTHKGRFKPVTAVKSRLVASDERLYEVSSPGARATTFVATGNHPALSYRFWANQESSLDYLVKNPCEQQWIPLDDIAAKRKTTDRIVNVLFPRFQLPPQTLHHIDMSELVPSVDVTETTCRYSKQWGSTKRYVDVNFDLGKLVGLYLAEGCNARGGFDMGFHKDESKTHVAWVKKFAEDMGCRVTVNESTSDNGCRMWTFNKHVGTLLRSFVKGRCAHEKSLDMQRVLSAGPDFIKGLLYGHHLGDGNHVHDKKTCTYSSSSQLIYQLRTLNSAFGLYPRIGHNKSKNTAHHDMWYLEFQAEGVTYLQLLEQGQQIKSGSRTRFVNNSFVGRHILDDVSYLIDEDGGYTVYDISVADDRSFIVESAVLHNCDFLSSGDTFLQPNDLDDLRAQIRDPIEKAGHDRNVWIWSHPAPGAKYVLAADISRGDAKDYSAFNIIEVETTTVVAEYMGKVPPEKMADIIHEWALKYNTALVAAELNTFGYFVNKKLKDGLGYKRLYYEKCNGDPWNYISVDPNENPGFTTNAKTRPQILTKLEELIRTKVLNIHSRRMYDQLQSFVWMGNKPMAGKDSFDDLIISLAIASWLVEGGAGISEQAKAMSYAMLDATKVHRTYTDAMPINPDEARPLVNPNIQGYNASNVYKPRSAEEVSSKNPRLGGIADYRWLFK